MAKRATDKKPFRPFLNAALASDVMRGGGGAVTEPEPARVESRREPEPHDRFDRPAPKVVEGPEQREPAPPRGDSQRGRELSFETSKKAAQKPREKRYLLTVDEEDRIEELVRSLARELRTPIKLSHLVRAALSLVLRSQTELLNVARGAENIERPSNGDTHGLARFENEVAKLLDAAIRRAQAL